MEKRDNLIDIDTKDTSHVSEPLQNEGILRLDGNHTEFQLFFRHCLEANQPCMVTNIGADWPCFQLWRKPDKTADVEYLGTHYQADVCVAQCEKKLYNVQEKVEMKLSEYLTYWRSSRSRCLYMKDWHFSRDFPLANVYRVPKFFASDWLGELYDSHPELGDDYRFVYMGPKHSWTPLHMDVFSSYSWSINITGRKRWLLLRPGAEASLRDSLGNLRFDEKLQVPRRMEEVYELEQAAGEAIFVPSGWHHQVWNLEDTISINHNWVNGSNIDAMYKSLSANLLLVKKEIADCEDMEGWHEHCQLMLRALYGINYPQFYNFLEEIIETRMGALVNKRHVTVYGDWLLGPNYLLYDLRKAVAVLEHMNSEADNGDYIGSSAAARLQTRLQQFLDRYAD